ncbi:MAG: hypothetical protein ACOC7N_06020 [Chloroflexota bacterium]
MEMRTRVLIIGGALGGVIGVLAAHLYLQAAGRRRGEGQESLPSFEPGDLIKLTLSVLGVLKLVDRLAKPGE